MSKFIEVVVNDNGKDITFLVNTSNIKYVEADMGSSIITFNDETILTTLTDVNDIRNKLQEK